MEAKKMLKVITKAVKNHSEENPVQINNVLIELLTGGANPNTALAAIRKAFKEAGIIATTSVSALSEARAWLKNNPFPESSPFRTFSDVRESAEFLQDKFSINEDNDKGVASAIKLVKVQLKDQEMDIPKKVHLGVIAELKIEYYNDSDHAPHTVEGLAAYLVENVDVPIEAKNDDFKKKMKITAGTDYSYSIMLRDGLTLAEMN